MRPSLRRCTAEPRHHAAVRRNRRRRRRSAARRRDGDAGLGPQPDRPRLLVGCDGRGVGVATRAGITRIGWGYGQTALVTAIAHEKPHNGIAHQFFMPAGPLAILPLPGGHHSLDRLERDRRQSPPRSRRCRTIEYLEALRPRFGDFLGEIALAGDAVHLSAVAQSLAERFVAPRVALVGDAAHGVHPIAGQGLNLGLRDVAALAEVLIEARAAGRGYRRPGRAGRGISAGGGSMPRRWPWAWTAVNRLFSNDNPMLRLGRDLGMGLVNALPGLRRGFIRQAAGLTGDLPKLLAGQQI